MTLVLSVHSRESFWLLTDRRLSYGGRRPPIDDAMKVLNLETTDGVGLLAYAGLGATARGTQPSEWMSAVLRGQSSLRFEQALLVLAAAANRELPRHLARMPGHDGTHTIVVPAFIRGIGPRVYSLDNVVDGKTGRHYYRQVSLRRTSDPSSPSACLVLAGTGGLYLAHKREAWERTLLSLVKHRDRGNVTDHVIADYLAALNAEAHRGVTDDSVGPRCIVIWRRRPQTRRLPTGGGHQFYTGVTREPDSGALPTIINGLDVQAIGSVLMEHLLQRAEPVLDTHAGLDLDVTEMNRLLGRLPSGPDDRLR